MVEERVKTSHKHFAGVALPYVFCKSHQKEPRQKLNTPKLYIMTLELERAHEFLDVILGVSVIIQRVISPLIFRVLSALASSGLSLTVQVSRFAYINHIMLYVIFATTIQMSSNTPFQFLLAQVLGELASETVR